MEFVNLFEFIQAKIIFAGLAIGTLVGFTGMGGGAFMTPLLILLGIPPTMAVGSDLMYAGITKIFGSIIHHRQETVNYKIVRYFAYGSVPSALIGIFFIAYLENQGVQVDAIIKSVLGVTLVMVAILMLARSLMGLDRQSKPVRWLPSSFTSITFTVVIGALGGFLVGITSVGSGTLFIALMILFYRLPGNMVVGTDIFHATILLMAAGLAQWAVGHVDWSLVFNLLLGSIPGVILGSKLTYRSPDHVIRPVLGIVLLVAGFKLI